MWVDCGEFERSMNWFEGTVYGQVVKSMELSS